MEILVLLKQTFDTEEKIVIKDRRILEEGIEFIVNPYDEYAIEEAVSLKEAYGGQVTVLTVGKERAESALRTALAMGTDHAILITQDDEQDEYVVSQWIAAAVRNKEYDLILGGNMAIDSGSGQVAIRVAELLGVPHVSNITKLMINQKTATVERDVEGDVETIEVALPFLATAQQGLNEPRYPSLQGIVKAKKKPLEVITPADLYLPTNVQDSRTEVTNQYLPVKKSSGKVLQGDVTSQVRELIHLLRNDTKVI